MPADREAKGSSTVGSFNFIRRIGFPSTIELISILGTLVLVPFLVILPLLGIGLVAASSSAIFLILVPSLVGEVVTDKFVLKDNLLTLRRLLGLELLSWLLLPFVLAIFVGLEIASRSFRWQDTIVLLLAVSMPIRILTLNSLTNMSVPRKISGSLLPPLLVSTSLSLFYPAETIRSLLTLGIVTSIAGVGVMRLIQRVERNGLREIGASPMGMFRAFLSHWLNRDPTLLEKHLADLGVDETIGTTILGFYDENDLRKGAIVVSGFHPGPYRDLGSGGLPSLMKQYLEERLGGIVHVPHGISGHQTNVITRADVDRLLSHVKAHFPTRPVTTTGTTFLRVKSGVAKASSQAFDHTALITLTMSPVDMEDLPLELGTKIRSAFAQRGFEAVLIDAHNSMRSETVVTEEQSHQLGVAAMGTLNLLNDNHQSKIRAGFAEDRLSDFSREDGIGPGGLSVLVVENESQRVAYLTIDGNNMESGFRETILSSLADLGIADGEVMTTDTHLVTGLVRSELGYYPVGAHLDKTLFLKRIRETVSRAISDMAYITVGVSKSDLTVRVLGKETFLGVTKYIGEVGLQVRKLLYTLELASSLIALVIIALA